MVAIDPAEGLQKALVAHDEWHAGVLSGRLHPRNSEGVDVLTIADRLVLTAALKHGRDLLHEIRELRGLRLAILNANEVGRGWERQEIVAILRELSEDAKPEHLTGFEPSAWAALDDAANKIEARGRKSQAPPELTLTDAQIAAMNMAYNDAIADGLLTEEVWQKVADALKSSTNSADDWRPIETWSPDDGNRVLAYRRYEFQPGKHIDDHAVIDRFNNGWQDWEGDPVTVYTHFRRLTRPMEVA